MSLTSHSIVAAALEILDRFGLADLSMRRIATALGVQPGALYWHFANKQSLLAALADAILAGVAAPADVSADGVSAWCWRFRDALFAHRDGADIVASVLGMGLAVRSPVELLAGAFAGHQDPDAKAALIVHFVLGHALDVQAYAQADALGIAGPQPPDPDHRFRVGVAVLTRGLIG